MLPLMKAEHDLCHMAMYWAGARRGGRNIAVHQKMSRMRRKRAVAGDLRDVSMRIEMNCGGSAFNNVSIWSCQRGEACLLFTRDPRRSGEIRFPNQPYDPPVNSRSKVRAMAAISPTAPMPKARTKRTARGQPEFDVRPLAWLWRASHFSSAVRPMTSAESKPTNAETINGSTLNMAGWSGRVRSRSNERGTVEK